jgi:DNA replication protein DnaC
MSGMQAVGDTVSRVIGPAGSEHIDQRPPKKLLQTTPNGITSPLALEMVRRAMMTEQSDDAKKVCQTCKGRGRVVYAGADGHPKSNEDRPCPECSSDSQRGPNPLAKLFKLPEKVKDRTFQNVKLRPEMLPALRVMATLVTPPHGIVTLYGSPGMGKTASMACVHNACTAAGIPHLYVPAWKLFGEAHRMFKPESGLDFDAVWEQVLRVPVLMFDDVHSEYGSNWNKQKIDELFYNRFDIQQDHLTIFAVNGGLDIFPDYVQSRLRDVECFMFEVIGPDGRQRKERSADRVLWNAYT